MKTNTFEHLESLCRAKRIVCERRGKRIELTTPDGGTTAECSTVTEALDTVRGDSTFAALPIVFAPARPELYEYRLSSHTGETLKEATGETIDDVAAQWGMMIDRSFPTGGNAAVLTTDGKQSFLVTWRRVTQHTRTEYKTLPDIENAIQCLAPLVSPLQDLGHGDKAEEIRRAIRYLRAA